MLVPVGTHFVPTGTYFCIFIEHKIELIFKKNELKIEMWKKLNFALGGEHELTLYLLSIPTTNLTKYEFIRK